MKGCRGMDNLEDVYIVWFEEDSWPAPLSTSKSVRSQIKVGIEHTVGAMRTADAMFVDKL